MHPIYMSHPNQSDSLPIYVFYYSTFLKSITLLFFLPPEIGRPKFLQGVGYSTTDVEGLNENSPSLEQQQGEEKQQQEEQEQNVGGNGIAAVWFKENDCSRTVGRSTDSLDGS